MPPPTSPIFVLNASQPKPSFRPSAPPHATSISSVIHPSRHLTAAPAAPASSAPGILELEVVVDDQLLQLSRGIAVLGSRLVGDPASLGVRLRCSIHCPGD